MTARRDLERAYAACEALARSHYENFPVASLLLPRYMRPHVAAVYAFARIADDIADEGDAPPAERRRALDAWKARLHAAVDGNDPAPDANEPIIAAAAHSIRSCDLPVALFDDLIDAFAQDTAVVRYDTWAGVIGYCRRSANPVGRLVLRIAGHRHDRLDSSSDALCTALQLANFWQDFGRDWREGRLYVPREASGRHGAAEADLAAGRMTPAWQAAIADCVAFTRAAFEDGRAVCDGVGGRLRLELRLTWLGGSRILDRVDGMRAMLLERRPALGAGDVPILLWRAATWRSRRTS